MAVSAATSWEVRTTGSDSNGGGFVAGASGTDYSQQNAAQFSGADLVVDAVTNTKVTSASHNFVATDIGNIIQITAGTGWSTGFYQIVSVASNAATLDRSPAAVGTTGGTWAEGGALATPGKAGAAHVGGNTIYIQSGAYTISSASSNVANGCVTLSGGSDGSPTILSGYGSTRGDYGTPPTLTASGISTFTIVNVSSNFHTVENIVTDGASLTSSRGINVTSAASTTSLAYRCKAINCTNGGIVGDFAIRCEATGCSIQPAMNSTRARFCWSHDNAWTGFGNNTTTASFCLSTNNSGSQSDGFAFLRGSTVTNCTAYGNGRHGFNGVNGNTSPIFFANCYAEGNGTSGTGYGFSLTGSANFMLNCGAYLNATGTFTPSQTRNLSFVTPTSTVFTNAVGNDFSLNNTVGGGASLRAAGFPGIFPGGTTTGHLDIGAVPHQDVGSTVIVVEDD